MKQVVLKQLILSVLFLFTQKTIAQTQTSTLPNGTKIPVKFSTRVTSDDQLEPQVVVASDILDSDGNVLISEGSFVKIYCRKTRSEHNGNNGGKITVTFSYTQAVDGKHIDLSGGYEAQGKANLAGNFVTMNGKKLKGKPAVINAETTYDGVITKRIYEVKVQKKKSVVQEVVKEATEITTTEEYHSSEYHTTSTTTIAITSANISKYIGKTFFSAVIPFEAFYLRFNADNTYVLATEGNGGGFTVNAGKFSLKDDKFNLTAQRCYYFPDGDRSNFSKITGKESGVKSVCGQNESFGNIITAKIISDEKSLYFKEYLVLNGRVFGVAGTEPKSGEAKNYYGIDVIIVGRKEGITTTSVKTRSTPSENSTLGVCYSDDLGEEDEIIQRIEKNETVTALARTIFKQKVSNIEDYWYLVKPAYDCEIWIHGQYLKFDGATNAASTTKSTSGTTNKTSTTTKSATGTTTRSASSTTPKINTAPTKTTTPSKTPTKPASSPTQKPVPAKPATPYK